MVVVISARMRPCPAAMRPPRWPGAGEGRIKWPTRRCPRRPRRRPGGPGTRFGAWLTVLHPRIAGIIAASVPRQPHPPPAPMRFRSLPDFAYLDNTRADGVYAVFTNQSQLWVSGDVHTAITALLGTITGYQLGITLDTVIALPTTHGTLYLNPTPHHHRNNRPRL